MTPKGAHLWWDIYHRALATESTAERECITHCAFLCLAPRRQFEDDRLEVSNAIGNHMLLEQRNRRNGMAQHYNRIADPYFDLGLVSNGFELRPCKSWDKLVLDILPLLQSERCDKHPEVASHPQVCPFKAEIYNVPVLCTCCGECREQCRLDT